MAKLSPEQSIQEEQYSFPYHYLPRIVDGRFTQSMSWAFGYQYMAAVEFLNAQLQDLEFESLLDVGCGDGRLIREISAVYPGKRVSGIDFSERAIAIASSMNPHLDYRYGDITDKDIQSDLGMFDVLTLVEVLEHIPLDVVPEFVEGLHSILSKDGALLITVPHTNKPVTAKHYQHFNLTSLERALEPHFELVDHTHIHRFPRVLGRLMRLFQSPILSLNSARLTARFYEIYKRRYFITDERSAGRLYARFKPRA